MSPSYQKVWQQKGEINLIKLPRKLKKGQNSLQDQSAMAGVASGHVLESENPATLQLEADISIEALFFRCQMYM